MPALQEPVSKGHTGGTTARWPGEWAPGLTPPSLCVFGKLLNVSGARLHICRVKIVRVLVAQGGRSWEGAHKKRWCMHSTILAPVSKACIPTARLCSIQSRKVIRWRGHGRCSVAPAVPSQGSSAHAWKSLEIFPTFFYAGPLHQPSLYHEHRSIMLPAWPSRTG